MRRQTEDNPIGHLTSPIVTGGAVIALKCKEGVIVATDTLLSYGGLLSTFSSTQSITESIDTNRYLATWWSLPLANSLTSRRLPED